MKKLSLESNALLEQIQCIKSIEGPMWLGAVFQVRQGTKRQVAADGSQGAKVLGGEGWGG